MQNKRVVYIEDHQDFRQTFTNVLTRGLGSDVLVESGDDWTMVERDIHSEDFADVYIFDNEVNDLENRWGAEMAINLQFEARKANKEVKVITLLSSSPKTVKNKLGAILEENDIPVLCKTRDAILCFFWVGHCLKEDRYLSFKDWLTKEGLQLLPSPESDLDLVGSKIVLPLAWELEVAPEGTLYKKPLDYLTEVKADLFQYYLREPIERQLYENYFLPRPRGKETF